MESNSNLLQHGHRGSQKTSLLLQGQTATVRNRIFNMSMSEYRFLKTSICICLYFLSYLFLPKKLHYKFFNLIKNLNRLGLLLLNTTLPPKIVFLNFIIQSKFHSKTEVLLKFGQNFEAKVWSRFWSWILLKLNLKKVSEIAPTICQRSSLIVFVVSYCCAVGMLKRSEMCCSLGLIQE